MRNHLKICECSCVLTDSLDGKLHMLPDEPHLHHLSDQRGWGLLSRLGLVGAGWLGDPHLRGCWGSKLTLGDSRFLLSPIQGAEGLKD